MPTVTLTDVNESLANQNKTLEKTDKNIVKMSNNLSSFLSAMKGEKLRGREEELEGGSTPSPAGAGTSVGGGVLGGLLGGLLAGLSPLVLGAAGAILASFDETLNDISRTFAAAFFGIGEKVKSLMKGFAGLFAIDGRIGKLLKFDILTKYFDDAVKSITRLFAGPDTLIGRISQFFKNTFSEESTIGKAFAKIKSALTFTEESGIVKLMKGLGVVLKKIFLPIGLIFTAYDTVKGIIEGYEKEGIVGGLVGGVTGFFKSVIGAPLNLLKDATAWILKKLGMEETAKWLQKNFDFEKLFDDIGEGLIKFIKSPIDTIKEWLQSVFGGKDKSAEEQLRSTPAINAALKSGGTQEARSYIEAEYSGKRQEELLGLLQQMEKNQYTIGTNGFVNFGKGTPAILHGEEAIVPKNSGLGSFLGKMMDASGPMVGFAHNKGSELQAKEAAMRAAGASDMDIAQSIMGDMPGIMGSLRGIGDKMDLQSIMPKRPSSNQMGNAFTSMVRESEETKQRVSSQPVIISDNSTRINSGGSSQTTLAVPSTVYDFDDPFVKGLRTI